MAELSAEPRGRYGCLPCPQRAKPKPAQYFSRLRPSQGERERGKMPTPPPLPAVPRALDAMQGREAMPGYFPAH